MANEKTINARLQQKHDIEAHWKLAANFIPKAGEIIVYDDLNKIKIGDGTTIVDKLPFTNGSVGEKHINENGEVKGEIFNDYANNTAAGLYSHAEGSSTTASGEASHAEGGYYDPYEEDYLEEFVIDDLGISITSTTAAGIQSHAEGTQTLAHGFSSHSEGYRTVASGDYSHAEGDDTTASGGMSHAEGDNTTASGDYSHAEGNNTTASGQSSHAEGRTTTASEFYSHAEGDNTTASGCASHAEGDNTTASGYASHAEGSYTKATGDYSHAEGDNTTASEYTSHAEGHGTKASGQSSHAEGNNTTASGSYSHAEGRSSNKAVLADNYDDIYSAWRSSSFSLAKGESSHVEGKDNLAIGNCSHAEGQKTIASNSPSHAEGYSTTASGQYSHAEGLFTKASGSCSHAEGYYTTASGLHSHAEGYYTIASGPSSHAGGDHTIADQESQTAIGKYNDNTTATSALFVVGNGTSDTDRKNAFAVNKDGSATLAKVGENDNNIATVGYVKENLPPVDEYVKKTDYPIAYESAGVVNVNPTAYGIGAYPNTGYLYIASATEAEIDAKTHARQPIVPNNLDYAVKKGLADSKLVWTDEEKAKARIQLGAIGKKYEDGGEVFNDYSGNAASGEYSHAEGLETISSGYASHAEGYGSTAGGEGSHAEGYGTQAFGDDSHTEGYGTFSGIACFEMTQNIELYDSINNMYWLYLSNLNIDFNMNDIAYIAYDNKYYSCTYWNNSDTRIMIRTKEPIAINSNFDALERKHLLILNKPTVGDSFIGKAAHAEGSNTHAIEDYSHTSGLGTMAIRKAQTVIGQYNTINTDALFVIGNGDTDSARNNAFTVEKNGDVNISGDVYVSGGVRIENNIYSNGFLTDTFQADGIANFNDTATFYGNVAVNSDIEITGVATVGSTTADNELSVVNIEYLNAQLNALITVADIDTICGGNIVNASEVTF